jgi:hypothetical protein
MDRYKAISASAGNSSISKLNNGKKRNIVKNSFATTENTLRKVAALHRHGITNMAHLELDQLIRKDKCHSVRNLPEDAINILPPTLRSTRIEYEEKGARIDCSLLSTIRSNDNSLVEGHNSTHISKKKKQIGSPLKSKYEPLEQFSSDEDDDTHASHELDDVTSAVSKLTTLSSSSVLRASVKRKSNLQDGSVRDNSNHKCDNGLCGCSKRVFQKGCCDVCRIYFNCSCSDCVFRKGRESGSLPMLQVQSRTRELLITAAAEYAQKSLDEDKRLGYLYERRKATVVKETNGRTEHNWRVGTVTGYVQCCDKAFRRFYRTSTKTLNKMKTKSVEMNSGVVEIAPSKTQNIPRRVIGSDFKPLCKTVSISHGILLDEDEKASLRWAPSKTKSSDDECYGWLYETFNEVAEEMPNR